jgi:hypothetical protein
MNKIERRRHVELANVHEQEEYNRHEGVNMAMLIFDIKHLAEKEHEGDDRT